MSEEKIPQDVQALIDCLDLMYNTVTQDIRDKFAPAMQQIRNELIANNRLALARRLHEKNTVLGKIANTRAVLLYGKTDHRGACKKMRTIAKEALP